MDLVSQNNFVAVAILSSFSVFVWECVARVAVFLYASLIFAFLWLRENSLELRTTFRRSVLLGCFQLNGITVRFWTDGRTDGINAFHSGSSATALNMAGPFLNPSALALGLLVLPTGG